MEAVSTDVIILLARILVPVMMGIYWPMIT